MRLSGRIAAAIEVLDGLNTRKRPVSLALKEWGQANRFAGSKDRAAIGNLVYDAMRKKYSHAHAMQSDSGRSLVLSVVVRDWAVDVEQLISAFETDNFSPDPITANEHLLLTEENPLTDAHDHIVADLPQWLMPSFQETFGEDWIAQAKAFGERPPLDLRVNPLKYTIDKATKSLDRFHPEKCEIAPLGLRIASGNAASKTPNVQADEAYLKGGIEIQDQGSQIVALLANAKPGQQVLDYCAGAGGKTMALATTMDNKGQLFAYDSDRNRLKPIYDRLKRNGVRNVQVRAPVEGALDNLIGKMDKVIVDAPCTGTGTWRRHPDSKWKLTPEQLDKRCAEQAKILQQAVQFVAPEGELVYITCSVLPEENNLQIEALIGDIEGFTPVSMKDRWDEIFPDASLNPLFDNCGATLSPHSTDTDGFYISILKRKS